MGCRRRQLLPYYMHMHFHSHMGSRISIITSHDYISDIIMMNLYALCNDDVIVMRLTSTLLTVIINIFMIIYYRGVSKLVD